MKKILLVSLMVLSMTVLTACGNRNAMDNGDNGTGITDDAGMTDTNGTDTTGTTNGSGTTDTTNGTGTTNGTNTTGTTGGAGTTGTTSGATTGTDDLNNTDNVNDVTAGDYNGNGMNDNDSIADGVGDAIDDAGNAASDIIDDAATGVENMVDDVTGTNNTGASNKAR